MKDINKIDLEILEVQTKMDALTEERTMYQANLTSLNAKLSEGQLPDKLYQKILEAKAEYTLSIQKNLMKHRKLKGEKLKMNVQRNSIERENVIDESQNIKDDLYELKEKYFQFYKDKTRIAPMRIMASDFIIDLENLITKI